MLTVKDVINLRWDSGQAYYRRFTASGRWALAQSETRAGVAGVELDS
jgi:hypothetical protein